MALASLLQPGLAATPLTSDPFPRVQLAISNPSQWNTEWETFYELSAGLTKPDYIMRVARSDRQRGLILRRLASTHDDRHGYAINYQSTCAIQAHLGVTAMEAFLVHDFERRWRAASVDERRRHGLVGLANAGAQAKNLNAARACCADILRLRYLTEDAEVLVRLLRDVTPQDVAQISIPTQPYYFPNKEWEALRARLESSPSTTENDKFDLMEVLMLRAKLIYLVLEGIMASFLGTPLPKISIYKERDRRPDARKKADLRLLKQEHAVRHGPGDGPKKLREELAAMDERKSRGRVYCEFCGRAQGEAEKFMRCKKCWDQIKREVKYCQKECQAADWKDRHKQICGKAVESMDEFLDIMKSQIHSARAAVPELPFQSQFAPPRNGFRRTPQLVYHIAQIDAKPAIEFVVQTKPGHYIELEFMCEPVSVLFRAVRKVAFEEGNREAVAKMCHYVIWFLRATLEDLKHGWDLNYAVDQMEMEFDFPDLRRAMKEMQKMHVADEFGRPPLLFPMSSLEWRQLFLSEDSVCSKLDRLMDEPWEVEMEDSRVVRIPGIWDGRKTKVVVREASLV